MTGGAAPDIRLLSPDTPALLAQARGIVREYVDSLQIDLQFQDIDAELDDLPGVYAAPHGLLLLAFVGDELAGCGALRPLPDADEPNACEMKRLYVRPAFRGAGLGRVLTEALMDHAIEAGYGTLLLDTLDDMEAARELYASLGFVAVPPYYFNPVPGAHYLKAELDGAARLKSARITSHRLARRSV